LSPCLSSMYLALSKALLLSFLPKGSRQKTNAALIWLFYKPLPPPPTPPLELFSTFL
jgi:hypothetical protein